MSVASSKASVSPEALVMQLATGCLVSKVIAEASRLGIPDLVKRYGALSTQGIIANGGLAVDANALERVLRACASIGVFSEDEVGNFGPNELSDVLTSESQCSVKWAVEHFGGPITRLASELDKALETGHPQARDVYGMEWWEYLSTNPKALEEFGELSKSDLVSFRGVLEHCDLTGVKRVADIGGGFGYLALALAEKYPGLRIAVLDLPQVVQLAPTHILTDDQAVADRLQFVAGNMFQAIPPAEVYILKRIIHDWDDESCIRVLNNCRTSMEGEGRVVCVDAILPPMGNTSAAAAKLLDIMMLLSIPGKERTERQWDALHRAAGLEICKITPLLDDFGTCIIEGTKLD